ncbi:cytochrome c biogenesis CcmF C-terminal-like mitochondrial protein [Prunus dulcis]|uniref:cytochrome c biogenesis CcmF C-terminal-like mitochondrial protein n=1 Tax=Prunus dulcis TaxID=3755 RepID=UPI00148289F5|nr:cytochrome c biogenesis CcmF C-terminal-like mitochondrial protein [Prunus dulcis]
MNRKPALKKERHNNKGLVAGTDGDEGYRLSVDAEPTSSVEQRLLEIRLSNLEQSDLSNLESFCGVLCLLFFRTLFSLPRDRSAKRERARRRKRQTLRPNGNEQRRNDKMRYSGHPHLERRVEGFGPEVFPVPPSSSGACVRVDEVKEIELGALALPTSRQPMAVGHDYYQKAPMKMNISHGEVCICMLGVLLSCDPAAYVRPVAHASYLFRAGGVNSDSIRVFNPAAEMLS